MDKQTDQIKTEDMPLKRWSLTFNEALEAEYQTWATTHLRQKRRFTLIAGIVLMLVFGLIDHLVFAEGWRLPLILHLAVALPLFSLALAANYYNWQQRYAAHFSLALVVVLELIQLILFPIKIGDSLVFTTTLVLQICLVLAYCLGLLAADFGRGYSGSIVLIMLIIMRLMAGDALPFEWRVLLSSGLVLFLLLSTFALYYRIYGERKFYYTTKGQTRFADKVGATTKSDPVIKRIESPVNKLFYAVSDVIWFITIEGDVAYVSPSVKEFMGYEPEELIGKRAITLMPPEVYRQFESKMTRLYKDKNIVQDVFDFRTKAGLIKSGEIHAKAYSDNEHGDGYVAATRPISEEKVKARASSEKRLKDLSEENTGLKSDLHNLTEEVATLTEKLTIVNREMTASGKISKKTFSRLLSDIFKGYQAELLPGIESQQDKLRQLVKRFKNKSMGKHDLTNYFEQAGFAAKLQVNELAFADNCYKLYDAVANEHKINSARHKMYTLFEGAVVELKEAFSNTEHIVNIDCDDDVMVQTDADLFADLVKYLLLRSLTGALADIKRGAINIRAFRVKQDIVIEYRDNGKLAGDSQFEQFFLQCLHDQAVDD